jgi:30S ribosomal protein 3
MSSFRLKLILSEDAIGIAVDKNYSNTFRPVTGYYFWPVSNAWEQLKIDLDSKIWINSEEKISILNMVSDILNNWQDCLNRNLNFSFDSENQNRNLSIKVCSANFL